MTTAPTLRSTLERSFALMREDAPEAYERLCLYLRDVTTRVRVQAETICLESDGSRLRLEDHAELPRIVLRTDRATLLDLAAARAALVDAILEDRLFVRGLVADLVALEQALITFLCWGVRNASARDLFRQYRDH